MAHFVVPMDSVRFVSFHSETISIGPRPQSLLIDISMESVKEANQMKTKMWHLSTAPNGFPTQYQIKRVNYAHEQLSILRFDHVSRYRNWLFFICDK